MLRKTAYLQILSIFVSLFILPGCWRLTDADVLSNAQCEYSELVNRYQDMIYAYNNDKDLVEQARLLGTRSGLGFGESLWQSMIGNEHLVVSEGAPLHKAEYILKSDIRTLERHAHILESRLLTNRAIYDKLLNLRRVLLEILPVLAKQKTYVNESQFIEQQRVQKAQLYESQRQTRLLETVARNQQVQPRQSSNGYTVKKTTTVEIWD